MTRWRTRTAIPDAAKTRHVIMQRGHCCCNWTSPLILQLQNVGLVSTDLSFVHLCQELYAPIVPTRLGDSPMSVMPILESEIVFDQFLLCYSSSQYPYTGSGFHVGYARLDIRMSSRAAASTLLASLGDGSMLMLESEIVLDQFHLCLSSTQNV